LKIKIHVLCVYVMVCKIHVTRPLSGRFSLAGPPRGGELRLAPTLIGPQLESESLKLSNFFKLVRAFLKLRAPYSSSTCSLAEV
jgi:hypothetical protein